MSTSSCWAAFVAVLLYLSHQAHSMSYRDLLVKVSNCTYFTLSLDFSLTLSNLSKGSTIVLYVGSFQLSFASSSCHSFKWFLFFFFFVASLSSRVSTSLVAWTQLVSTVWVKCQIQIHVHMEWTEVETLTFWERERERGRGKSAG